MKLELKTTSCDASIQNLLCALTGSTVTKDAIYGGCETNYSQMPNFWTPMHFNTHPQRLEFNALSKS
jgi:hypothetical protein